MISSYQREIGSFNEMFQNDKFMKDFLILENSNAYDPNFEDVNLSNMSPVQKRFHHITSIMAEYKEDNKNLSDKLEDLRNKLNFDQSTILKLKKEIDLKNKE